MKIVIIQDRLGHSLLDGTKISELPKGLGRMLFGVIQKLKKVKTIVVSGKVSGAILELPTKKVDLSYLAKDVRLELVRCLELAKWYLDGHTFPNNPDIVGGGSTCTECHSTLSFAEACPSWCPSHKKWKLIDPAYKMPENPMQRYLEKLDREGVLKKRKVIKR